jgi:hypothetical protein
MPEICRFFGIVIYIYYKDHQPPHFHAVYAEHEAKISIDNLTILFGSLPPRVLGLVIEWANIHNNDLQRVWNQAVNRQPLDKIEPLK